MTSSFQKKFDAVERQRDEALNALGEEIRMTLVLPACRKYRLEFVSGMGTWFFLRIDPNAVTRGTYQSTVRRQIHDEDDAKRARIPLRRVIAALNIDVDRNNSMGTSYVGCVREEDLKENTWMDDDCTLDTAKRFLEVHRLMKERWAEEDAEHKATMIRLEAETEERRALEEDASYPGEPDAETAARLKVLTRKMSKTLRIPMRDIRLAMDGDCLVGVTLQDRFFRKNTFDVIHAEGLRCCINVVEAEHVTGELRSLSPWRAWRRAFKTCVATVRMG